MASKWSYIELQVLTSLVGRYPIGIINTKYNAQIASINEEDNVHYPMRTPSAILRQIRKLQLSIEPYTNYLKITEIAEILNISPNRIKTWIYRNQLTPIKRNNIKHSWYAIAKSDISKLARKHPYLLYECDPDGLKELIGEVNYQKWQAAIATKPSGLIVKIHDKKTGQTLTTQEAS
jgi:hypothetical protein